MSRIKSAWEIALEKTENLEVDEEKLKAQEQQYAGKALAGRYLNNMEMTAQDLASQLVSDPDFRQGLVNVVLSNIVLPTDSMFAMRFDRLTDISGILNPSAGETMARLKGFLENYLEERENYVAGIEQQIRQSNGQIDPAQLTQIIQQNLRRLDAQYQETLDNTRETLRSLLD